MQNKNDVHWIQQALQVAQVAYDLGEVPVGCVIVQNNELVASGHNLTVTTADPTAHAEIVALRKASKKLANYRLPEVTVYSTLEPCTMCIGALLHARVQRLVFAASDPKFGAVGSVINVLEHKWNHTIDCSSGLLAAEAGLLLRKFFQQRRS